MSLRAEPTQAFLLKYFVIGLACTGLGLWAVYDALVAYPSMIPRAEYWESLEADESLDAAARNAAYKETAEEKGWSVERPTKKESLKEIQQGIVWQYVFMTLGFGLGIPLLIWYLRNKSTWIESDGKQITSSWGQAVPFADIIKFDKNRWQKKGLGVVHYNDNGSVKKFVVDDLKYDRQITDEIVRKMEAHIGHDKIVNGDPEEPYSHDPV